MKNTMSENLKKRIKSDFYVNRILTILLGTFAVYKVFNCVRTVIDGNVMKLSQENMIGDAVRVTLIFMIFIVMDIIMRSVLKHGKPFTKKTVNCLRTIAILIMLVALLPKTAEVVEGLLYSGSSYITFDFVKDGTVLMIGAVFGIIAEIFRYGCDLEEEMDSIA